MAPQKYVHIYCFPLRGCEQTLWTSVWGGGGGRERGREGESVGEREIGEEKRVSGCLQVQPNAHVG